MPINRINRLRKESGMNQKELGAMLGVGQTTISAWETGKNEPDNESMHKMAKLFQVSIGYLMGYESNPYSGLSKEELRQIEEKSEEELLKKMEEVDLGNDIDINPAENEEADFLEWKETDQMTYFEFFQLNKLGDYLTKDQRQRILDVAKIMFPNVEKGLYTDETAHK